MSKPVETRTAEDGMIEIPDDPEGTAKIREAFQVIAKLHNLPVDEHGMPRVKMANPLSRRLFRWRVRAMHIIGLHYDIPVTTYDWESGAVQFSGTRCLVCGRK